MSVDLPPQSDSVERVDRSAGISPPRVFISYRRSDTGDLAKSVAERLRSDLGGSQVFRDAEDLIAGQDWRSGIDDAIRDADSALVLIGPEWTGVSPDGSRRIDEDGDVVAHECRRILSPETRCEPLPILVGLRSIPDLSSEFEPLFDRHAVFASSRDLDRDADEAYQRILVGVWDSVRRRNPRGVLVIGDRSAIASIDAVVEDLRQSNLIDARRLSRFAAGAAVVTTRRLRRGRQRWPDAIVVVDDQPPSSSLAARVRALDENPNVERISFVGSGVIAGLALGQVIGAASSTAVTASSGIAPAIPSSGTGPVGAAVASWHGASRGMRAAVAAALIAGGGVVGVSASGLFESDDAYAATYGYLDVQLGTFRESTDVPEGFDPDEGTFVSADLTVANPLQDSDLTIPASIFEMTLRNEVQPAMFADARSIEVGASSEATHVLWWRFSEGVEVADPEIQIREEGGTPLVLPVERGTERSAPLQMKGAYETECRLVSFGDGVASLNAGVSPSGDPGPAPNGTNLGRAGEGEVFASFDFSATERCSGAASFFYLRYVNFTAIRETRVGDRLVNSGHRFDDNDWTGQVDSETVDGVLTMNVPANNSGEELEVVFNLPGDETMSTTSDLSGLSDVVPSGGD